MELIKKVRKKYNDWIEKRFLSRYGCSNRAQLEIRYDQDYNPTAKTIKEYFHGYKHVYVFDDLSSDVYYVDIGFMGIISVVEWCQKNTTDKYRIDYINVRRDTDTNDYIISDDMWHDYCIPYTPISEHYYFLSFKSSKDFLLFSMRFL